MVRIFLNLLKKIINLIKQQIIMVSILFFVLAFVLGFAFYKILVADKKLSKKEEIEELKKQAKESERRNNEFREQLKNQ